MPTPQEVKDIVDGWLAARWPTLQNRQTLYASNHNGRYYQGLFTHSTIPTDGQDATPDNITATPTDQPDTWADFVTLPSAFPCSLSLDVYQNAAGWGYVATVRVFILALNRLYQRSQNGAGTETHRTVGWHQIDPPA